MIANSERSLHRSWGERLVLGVAVLSIVAALLVAGVLTWALRKYQNVTFVEVEGIEANAPGEPANWLLVGADSREGIDPDSPYAGYFLGEEVIGKRTDTMMVARVDPEEGTVDLLSIPRDLWVPIVGTGSEGRINGAFNGEGGEARLVATVENSLGITINHYAEISFAGFAEVVDAIGGVPVWFDTPMRDPGSGLNVEASGCHILGGFDALAFARSRKLEYREGDRWRNDGTGDLGRTARQQYLLSRLASTATKKVNLTGVGTLDAIATSIGNNLTFGDNVAMGDLMSMGRTFSAVGGDQVRRHSLPVRDRRTSGGALVLDLLRDEAEPVLKMFRPGASFESPNDETVPLDTFIVRVENGARVAKLAGRTAEQLAAAGVRVGEVGDAAQAVDATVVRYPAGQEAAAATLGQHLLMTPQYQQDDTSASVVLVVGADYAQALDAAAGGSTQPPATQNPAAPSVGQTPTPTELAAGPGPSSPPNEVGLVPESGPIGTPCE